MIVHWLDVATILSTLVALFALNLFLRKSVRGLAMRASAEDFTMTRMMGVRANTVITASFAVSGVLAGIAAFFYLGATTGQVGYDYGFNLLLKGFVAAVIGGLGSLSGAVLGGFIVAAMEVFLQITLPADQTPYSAAIVFGIVILVLLFRPQGIVGARGAQGGARVSSEAATTAPVAKVAPSELWIFRALAGGGSTAVVVRGAHDRALPVRIGPHPSGDPDLPGLPPGRHRPADLHRQLGRDLLRARRPDGGRRLHGHAHEPEPVREGVADRRRARTSSSTRTSRSCRRR